MTEPVRMRADQLSVGDLVPDAYLPHRFNKGPAEVRFVADDGEGHTFFAFRYPNGQHDSTTVLSESALEVYPAPAPTGLDYSRPADSDDPQPSGGREPMHTGAMTDGGLVDETEALVHFVFLAGDTACGVLPGQLPDDHAGTRDPQDVTCEACASAVDVPAETCGAADCAFAKRRDMATCPDCLSVESASEVTQ